LLLIPVLLSLAASLPAQSCSNCASCGMSGDTSMVIGQLKVQMPTLAGDTFDLGSNIGTKPVVIFHIGDDSSWDATARLVQKTADENPDIVFAATFCDTGAESFKHVRSLHLTLPVMLDPGGKQFNFCQQNGCTPIAVFVSAAGDIVLNTSDVTTETMKQGLDGIAAATTTTTTTVDPVCGMTIDQATAHGSYQYKGNTYYFCSANCENLFKKNPGKYLKQ
jgi:YHS domain-containing protein